MLNGKVVWCPALRKCIVHILKWSREYDISFNAFGILLPYPCKIQVNYAYWPNYFWFVGKYRCQKLLFNSFCWAFNFTIINIIYYGVFSKIMNLFQFLAKSGHPKTRSRVTHILRGHKKDIFAFVDFNFLIFNSFPWASSPLFLLSYTNII